MIANEDLLLRREDCRPSPYEEETYVETSDDSSNVSNEDDDDNNETTPRVISSTTNSSPLMSLDSMIQLIDSNYMSIYNLNKNEDESLNYLYGIKNFIETKIAEIVMTNLSLCDLTNARKILSESNKITREVMISMEVKDKMKELKESLENEKAEEELCNDIFSQLDKKYHLRKEIYDTIIRSPIDLKHKLFPGNELVSCSNNIIYHFKNDKNNSTGASYSVHPTMEFSKIKCRESTNNYIQVVHNKKSEHITIIMPDRNYMLKLPHRYIPVDIQYNGSNTGHLSYFIFESKKSCFYFDVNGISLPNNEVIDKCFRTICEDLKFEYQPVSIWRNNNLQSLQLPKKYRECYNKGDCVILSLLFMIEYHFNFNQNKLDTLNYLNSLSLVERKNKINMLYHQIFQSCNSAK